ncbi:40_t:CDS:2 [Funneliformis mosseae]|uniref:40_t:CDS:1 n=1 Tax=Funneliformis mosseae TaxID=27381 RepID=A0A9N9CGJ0_FUNMO|nr:40_t:CDS:2 [Funneliformis mosseae]
MSDSICAGHTSRIASVGKFATNDRKQSALYEVNDIKNMHIEEWWEVRSKMKYRVIYQHQHNRTKRHNRDMILCNTI